MIKPCFLKSHLLEMMKGDPKSCMQIMFFLQTHDLQTHDLPCMYFNIMFVCFQELDAGG